MKKIVILTLLIATLNACSSEQVNMFSEGDVALAIRGGASGMNVTKGTLVELPASTAVGVYALETGMYPTTLQTTSLANYLYTASGVNGVFNTDLPIVLKKDKTYNVCAYSPIVVGTNIDATAVPFIHGTDVLYANWLPVDITKLTASASLVFEHKMSQITVKLRPGFGNPDMTGVTLRLSGFYESCTMNLTDGKITPQLGGGAAVTQINTPICFVPSTAPMNLFISVTTSDKRIYTGVINRIFLPSTSYVYTLTLNKENPGLDVASSVVDWTSVSGGDPIIVVR